MGAGHLDLELGEFVQVADSLHCYEEDLKVFTIQGGEAPRATSRIALPRREAREVLVEAMKLLELLASEGLKPREFERVALSVDLPTGYRDLLSIVSSDSARRRGWADLAGAAAATCTDRLLQEAWRGWKENRAQAALLGKKPAVGRAASLGG